MKGVEHIKELLHDGEAIQVVLSSQASAEFHGDAFTLYRRMRSINPSPYMFFMRLPEVTLFGSSPELMVRCTDGKLQLSPIAGTRKRGRDDEEDSALAADLLKDPKECSEHVMLVDLGRNDLGRVAKPGSVKLERLMEIERFSHVMHMTSRVTAQVNDGLDALDILGAAFPAGTVSGAPKVRAMEILAEEEPLPRRAVRRLHRLAGAGQERRPHGFRHYHPQHVGEGRPHPLAGGRRHRVRFRSGRRMAGVHEQRQDY